MKKIILISTISFILIPSLAYIGLFDDLKSLFDNWIQGKKMEQQFGAATILFPYQGGTGTSTTPTDLKLLLGRGNGTYYLPLLTAGTNITIATSTTALTISSTASGGGSNWNFIGSNAIKPTTTVGIIVNASSTFAGDLTVGTKDFFVDVSEGRTGIGTTTLAGLLTVGTSTPLFVVGSNNQDVFIRNIRLRNTGNGYLYITDAGGGSATLDVAYANMSSVRLSEPTNYIYGPGVAGRRLLFTAGSSDLEVARMVAHATAPYFIIGKAGNLIPVETSSTTLGNASTYWKEAYIDNIYTSGNVGIGTVSPGYKLTVSAGGGALTGGDFAISSAGTATTTISSGVSTFAGGIISQASSTFGYINALGFTGNASTADAFKANPSDCSANQFANTIAASGNLTCAAIADADVPDTITVSNYLAKDGTTQLTANWNAGSFYITAYGITMTISTTTGTLVIPTSANPSILSSGSLAINTTQASSSVRYHDGTAERALFDVFEKSFWVASTTDDENNNSFNNATATFALWNPARSVTIVGLYGKTDVGTVIFACGDGTNWTESILATASGVEDDGSIANGSFEMREEFQCKIGSATTVPSKITVTVELRYVAD